MCCVSGRAGSHRVVGRKTIFDRLKLTGLDGHIMPVVAAVASGSR